MSWPRCIFVVSMWSFFIFIFIFIMINRVISWIQIYLFFCLFLGYVPLFLNDNVNEKCEKFSNSKSSVSGCCLAFAWCFADFSRTLLIKVLLIKKACNWFAEQNWFANCLVSTWWQLWCLMSEALTGITGDFLFISLVMFRSSRPKVFCKEGLQLY